MTSTNIANYALAFIGEPRISDINDPNSTVALTCSQWFDQTCDEVLRTHRWNCATRRATLSRLVQSDSASYPFTYSLPTDFLRLLEVNGEAAESSSEFFEIEGKTLLIKEEAVTIRYIARILPDQFDPLLTKAVALALAATIAIPLTSKLQLQAHCLGLFHSALSRARQIDAVESGSRENRPLERLLAQSPLLSSRHHAKYPRS